jgi:hypothetical protein
MFQPRHTNAVHADFLRHPWLCKLLQPQRGLRMFRNVQNVKHLQTRGANATFNTEH